MDDWTVRKFCEASFLKFIGGWDIYFYVLSRFGFDFVTVVGVV